MIYRFGSYGRIAEKDLVVAESLFKASCYTATATYSEQAVEKLLKGVIYTYLSKQADACLLDTDSTSELVQTLATKYSELSKYITICRRLDQFHPSMQYPDTYVECKGQEALDLLTTARDIFAIVIGSTNTTYTASSEWR